MKKMQGLGLIALAALLFAGCLNPLGGKIYGGDDGGTYGGGKLTPVAMVWVEGGTFMMGSPTNETYRNSNETQHEVTLTGFYMGRYEVTQKEWVEVMGNNPSYFKGDDLPVESVSWYEAVEYCNKRSEKEGLSPAYTIDKNTKDPNNQDNDTLDTLKWKVTLNKNANGYRLPTEAEWEYAARGGSKWNSPYYVYAGRVIPQRMWRGITETAAIQGILLGKNRRTVWVCTT